MNSPLIPDEVLVGCEEMPFEGTNTQRQKRALCALLRGPQSRIALDDIAGTTNAPEIIAQLRRKGLTIPCERIDVIDRDGQPCKPGVYRLTDEDRHVVNAWFRGGCK